MFSQNAAFLNLVRLKTLLHTERQVKSRKSSDPESSLFMTVITSDKISHYR